MASPQPHGAEAPPLARMRRYTFVTLLVAAAVYAAVALAQTESWLVRGVVILASLPLGAVVTYWDRRPPTWLAATSLAAGAAAWIATIALRDTPLAALVVSAAASSLASRPGASAWRFHVLGIGALIVPVAVAELVTPDADFLPYLGGALAAYVGAVLLFGINAYVWNLYVQIDRARESAAELAVARERFRIAADLHDIQGHTLHVLRLKLQVADRLLGHDTAAVRAQLAEAQSLVATTLADTRNLAFGDRAISLPAELANAHALLTAAGIRCTIDGRREPGPGDELLGLVVRESATNILRHAQATVVKIRLSPAGLRVENDGATTDSPRLRGLATLASRIADAGGFLTSTSRGGTFVTEVELR